jgi:hypothetical protein
METKKLVFEIIERANKLAGNSNFYIQGFDQARFLYAMTATLEVLQENGLLSGCLLCKNSNKEKEES